MGESTFEQLFEAAIRHHRAGQVREAIGLYRQAAELRAEAAVWNNLSLACREVGDVEGAVDAARRAVVLAPGHPGFWTNQGNLFREMGKLDEAIGAHRQALQLRPDSVAAINNLAVVLHDSGLVEEAIGLYRRGVDKHPNEPMVHSNLLYAMHFDPRYDSSEILREHRVWAQRHADPLLAGIPPHPNSADPERPLRIGYVSAYLQDHVVGRFMLPLLQAHDRARFPAFCYADESGIRDAMTQKLMAASDAWRGIRGASDDQVAEWVRQDQIDILVDLGMHMSGSRLGVFARKPAPVQVTYLAYCSTTGVKAIDYRLTDPYLDPQPTPLATSGESSEPYSEKSIWLPETYWCYQPPEGAGEPGPVPVLTTGVITFASLNSFSKVTVGALKIWARILNAVPRSRLLLHAREGAHRQRVTELFAREGISEPRINFVGFVPLGRYFDLYRISDIALDPFPYAGGTTTCDAIWTGVPVITLAGNTAVGRGGVSILTNIGATELIASNLDEYVQIAANLANDLPRLIELRQSLRTRMMQSPLTDEPRFARQLEHAYRGIWNDWCAGTRG
ncbi:MAG TPA: tetratricopeptide repeat protein [Tepidisphaeraceae bacterium]